jgi:hypothetical protein
MPVPALTFGSTVAITCSSTGDALAIHAVGGEHGGLSMQPSDDSETDHGGCLFVMLPPRQHRAVKLYKKAVQAALEEGGWDRLGRRQREHLADLRARAKKERAYDRDLVVKCMGRVVKYGVLVELVHARSQLRLGMCASRYSAHVPCTPIAALQRSSPLTQFRVTPHAHSSGEGQVVLAGDTLRLVHHKSSSLLSVALTLRVDVTAQPHPDVVRATLPELHFISAATDSTAPQLMSAWCMRPVSLRSTQAETAGNGNCQPYQL